MCDPYLDAERSAQWRGAVERDHAAARKRAAEWYASEAYDRRIADARCDARAAVYLGPAVIADAAARVARLIVERDAMVARLLQGD